MLKWDCRTMRRLSLAKLDRLNNTLPFLQSSDLTDKLEGTVGAGIKAFDSAVLQFTLESYEYL